MSGGDLQDSQQEDVPAALGVCPAATDGAPTGGTAADGRAAASTPDPVTTAQLRALLAAWGRMDAQARVALVETAKALARS